MKPKSLLALLPCLLAACAVTPFAGPPDTAQVPPGVFGSNGDNAIAGIALAAWAFALPSRTHGRPADAAQASASVDYLAGQLSNSPRWAAMDSITKQQMLQARGDLRKIIGVAPGMPSQRVVNALLAASGALRAGDEAAAIAALSPPVFTRPGAETLQSLTDLPYLQMANLATSSAQAQEFPGNLNRNR